jgi:predicted amidohydrolase
MKTGVFQFTPVFGDKEHNLRRIERVMEDVQADMLVLPELCTTGYLFTSAAEMQSLAESVPGGKTVRRLEAACRKKRLHVVAGLAEAAGSAFYNSAVLVGPEGWIGTYRKIHLFWKEKDWFARGNRPFRVWDIGKANIGLMICFDWIYPEAARSLALDGADILCHCANLVLPHCPDAMITRSLENRVFSITANRTGAESRGGSTELKFIGKSQMVGPWGEVLFRMDDREEGVRIVEIDPKTARDKHIIPANDIFKDRKPEYYTG